MHFGLYIGLMIDKLKENYGSIFEAALISEIERVGITKEVVSGTQLMHI
jgi:hypothetical protein